MNPTNEQTAAVLAAIETGALMENILSNGRRCVVRVLESLPHIAGVEMFRVTDTLDTFKTKAQLIADSETWAAPATRLVPHPINCCVCHRDGLIAVGG